MDGQVADELTRLRFEVDVLRQRMQASIDRGEIGEVLLIGVCRGMISDRELRIRQLEQRPSEYPGKRLG